MVVKECSSILNRKYHATLFSSRYLVFDVTQARFETRSTVRLNRALANASESPHPTKQTNKKTAIKKHENVLLLNLQKKKKKMRDRSVLMGRGA